MRNYLLIFFVLVFANGTFGQIHIPIELCFSAEDGNPQVNEPSIAINPNNTAKLIAGSNLDWVYYSNDSGKTWFCRKLESEFGFYGDPVLHYTDSGIAFITHLSKTQGKAYGDWFDRIVIDKSEDDGKTFDAGSFVGLNEPKMQDKPWLSSRNNQLYISWTEFDKYGSDSAQHKTRIKFATSKDLGQNWINETVISDRSGDCKDGDNTVEGATTVTTSSGTVIAAWAGHGNIYMDQSLDGGITWGTDEIICKQKGGWNQDIGFIYRGNGMPFLGIDKSENHKDRLYLLYGEEGKSNNWVVRLKYSDNLGKTWKEVEILNEGKSRSIAQLANGKDQLFSNIDIDPKTGNIALVWYTRKNCDYNLFLQAQVLVLSPSNEGFKIKEYKLSPSFPPMGPNTFFGDYSDVSIVGDSYAGIYTYHNGRGQTSIKVLSQSSGNVSDAYPNMIHFIGKRMQSIDSDSVFLQLSNQRYPFEIKIKKKGFLGLYWNLITDKISANDLENNPYYHWSFPKENKAYKVKLNAEVPKNTLLPERFNLNYIVK